MAPEVEHLSPGDVDLLLQAVRNHRPSVVVDTMTGEAAVGYGENVMSVVTRVSVAGRDLDTGDKVTLSLIMKRPPESAERRQLFLCDAAFSNEAAFYRQVAPGLGLARDGKLPFAPCLLAAGDVMVLADLRQEGFTMADRRAGLDLDHCVLVIKELGRYHAFSYALKHLQPAEFSKMSSAVTEVFIHKGNTILIGCIDHCIGMAIKAAKSSSAVVDRLQSHMGRGIDVLTPHVVPEEPLAVICHGDFHSNNILFRYTNNNKLPTDVSFVDLQGCRYASPVLDILYFIFSSGSSEVLRSKFLSLLSEYQISLKNQLKALAPSAEAPSLDDVLHEVKRRLDYGLIMSLLVLPMVAADKVTFDFDTVSHETLLQVQQEVESDMINDQYKQRINDLFELITRENLLNF